VPAVVSVAVGIVIVVRYVVEVAVVTAVDVPVVVATYEVDVAVVVVVVVVASAGPIAGAFTGANITSATMIMQAIAKVLTTSCLFKSTPARCWA
jgi:hypothetical protein